YGRGWGGGGAERERWGVRGVEGGGGGRESAAELVRRRQHDLAVQFLDRPAGGDEPRREMVEQLGVRWPLAQRAEVARRQGEPLAEVVWPRAIDQDPRCQRVVLARNHLGQLQPSAALAEGLAVGGKYFEESVRRVLAECLRVAAQMHLQRDRLRVLQGVSEGIFRRDFFFPLFRRLLSLCLLDGLRRDERRLHVVRAGAYSGGGGVVPLRDRFGFVVVATGAGHGQPKEAARQRVDAVVELIELFRIAIVDGPDSEEAERRQTVEKARPGQQVGGDLLLDEAVIRHVAVERLDDPVAIAIALRIQAGREGVGLV